MKILIIGNGYLGNRCLQNWPEAVMAEQRVESKDDILALLEKHKPDAVLNAAGVVGKPNVDWCEDHQLETIAGNTILPINIAFACQQKNVYMLHMGTGCIFYGSSPSGEPWSENDSANPSAVYTKAKYAADLALSTLPNLGVARIRMPLDSVDHPANLINKLASYKRVVDVCNSLTVVDDMIDVFYQLLSKKAAGIFHVTNPGSITHKEIIELYKKIVDQNHNCSWISEQELVTMGLAKRLRSNNVMQSNNLAKFGISMRPVLEAVQDIMEKYARNRQNK